LITVLIAAFGLVPQLLGQGQVSQVNYTAGLSQRTIHTVSGTAVADGNRVWIGTFDAGFNVSANAADPFALLAAWNQFGSTNINTIIGQPGHFTGSSSSADPVFTNQKIYLWIFSTDLAAAPAGDFSNVNEYGLFSSTLANWTYLPPGPSPSNLRNVNSNEVDQNFFGNIQSTRLLLGNGFVLVPEPSTLGLLSLAIPTVVLALRKRRPRP
jgi:hypothetical protein